MSTNYKLKTNNSKLKIGIVCYPSVGGSGVVATNLGKALAEMGNEVHFISYEQPFQLDLSKPNLQFHKVNINEYALFKYPDYTLPLAETMAMVHQRYKLDVLHVHYAVPHATAALLARGIMRANGQTPPKVVTTLHGTDITLLANDPNLFSVIKYSIERSDGVTAVSQSLKDETLKTLATKKDIKVIYNFYNPQAITKSKSAVRKSLKIKDSDFLAIHLSNLRPVKRIPDLLKIISKLKNEKSLKLLILAGNDFKEFNPLVKKLNISKRLIIREKVKDIENYINAADVGVYTSEDESFGMGILETMSYGKPVLATHVGGVPEVMRNNIDGYLFKVGDIKGFAGKLKLLLNNPPLLQKLGNSAAKRAKEKFSADVIVKQYISQYVHTCEIKK
jgi:L-malate glycosyltransferase